MNDILNNWLESSSAQKFFEQERHSFQTISDPLCGQMGIQLSLCEKVSYQKELLISSQYQMLQNLDNSDKEFPTVIAELEALPFANNQFRVVIVPQMNLFCIDPHAALREIYRITDSDGFIAISGINQTSLIALQAKLSPKKFPFLPTVGLGQMKVWLSLLGCDIVRGKLFHYSAMQNRSQYPTIARSIERIGDRWLPMFAGGYWLVAKKRIFGQVIPGPRTLKRYKPTRMANQIANKL